MGKTNCWFFVFVIESWSGFERRGSKWNFRWVWWSFDINCAVAKARARFNVTAATVGRATGHTHRLCQSIQAASHESIDLEKLPLDVAECGCDGVHYRFAMFANYPLLFGYRTRSKGFKIGRFKSRIEFNRTRWLSSLRRLQLHVTQLSLLKHFETKRDGHCEYR